MRAQDPAAGAIPERLHSKHIGVPIIYQGEAKIYQGGAVAAVATTSKATSSKARFPGGLHKVPPPPRATGLESVVPSSSAAAAADDYQASTESTPSRPNFTGSDTSEGSGVNHAELLTSQARAAFMQLAAEAANLVPLDLSLPGPPPPPSARLTFPIDQHPLMKGHPPRKRKGMTFRSDVMRRGAYVLRQRHTRRPPSGCHTKSRLQRYRVFSLMRIKHRNQKQSRKHHHQTRYQHPLIHV